MASALLIDNLPKRVTNLIQTFHWIAGTDRFWFRQQRPSGTAFVVVDAETGQQAPAFDTEAMRAALNAAHPGIADAPELPITGLRFERDGSRAVVETPKGAFACDLPIMSCTPLGPPPGADIVVSPDGSRAVVRRENDLWLRDLASGAERRLTNDGEAHFGYGDIDPSYDTFEVYRRRTGQLAPLLGVLWSPDGRFIVALRQDLRPYPERLFAVEFAAPDHAYAHAHIRKMPVAGDAAPPESHLVTIDTHDFTVRPAALDPQALNDVAFFYFFGDAIWWTADELFVITANRGGSRSGLVAIRLATGETREIVSETAPINVRLNPNLYSRPNVEVLGNGEEIVWYSERSGHGHLYLYDGVSGALKRSITSGAWVVFDLLRIDKARRLAYFTAGPRAPGDDPYYRHLYCASLDGGEPQLLTPEDADHDFSTTANPDRCGRGPRAQLSGSCISPSGRYFVDSFSTVARPPKTVLRRITGELISDVVAGDASDLYATGWRPPERFTVKAADGTTDLYGILVRPRDFDPAKIYPVIDVTYPGPQGRYAPRTFREAITNASSVGNLQAFADAGFVVVVVDGRGTACRSRAFRDAFLRTEDPFGAADHVAAITNLAAGRPCMGLFRVGIIGVSYGGYGSLRAFLLYPDFFKVCVSAEGPATWIDMQMQLAVEHFFGVPSESPEARRYYETASNTALASRLKGKLLLIFGGIDQNVPLKQAFVTADAFIKADKDFDLLIVPDSSHATFFEPYAVRRSLQYFVEHLAGRPVR